MEFGLQHRSFSSYWAILVTEWLQFHSSFRSIQLNLPAYPSRLTPSFRYEDVVRECESRIRLKHLLTATGTTVVSAAFGTGAAGGTISPLARNTTWKAVVVLPDPEIIRMSISKHFIPSTSMMLQTHKAKVLRSLKTLTSWSITVSDALFEWIPLNRTSGMTIWGDPFEWKQE